MTNDDADIDAMLDGLDLDKPALPSKWNEPVPVTDFQGKRHDERDVNSLLGKLNQRVEMPTVRVPEAQPFVASTAGPCAACSKPISDAHFNTVEELKFHESCMRCSKCNASLNGGGPLERNGRQLVCSRCIALPRCQRCAAAIQLTDRFVEADSGAKYHSPQCLTCAKCRTSLGGDAFAKAGDLYCRECF